MQKQGPRVIPKGFDATLHLRILRNCTLCIFLVFIQTSCKKSGPVNETAEPELPVASQSQQKTKKFEFSGYWWYVKNSDVRVGPGDNYFNDKNAWVDNKGRLHLKLTKDSRTKKWYAAEVWTEKKFGYGKYEWKVEGRIDRLHKNVVFGLFDYPGWDNHDEIDIEFAKWGRASNDNLTYTVWPAINGSGGKWKRAKDLSLNGTYSTHRFTRSASSITFQSLHGFQNGNSNLLHTETCTKKSIISTLKMPVHINLWLYDARPPSDEVEIIIHSFKFSQ